MNRLRVVLAFSLLALASITFAGRATEGETRISLNGFWQFKTDPLQKGQQKQWHLSGFNDTGWDKMDVPGSW